MKRMKRGLYFEIKRVETSGGDKSSRQLDVSEAVMGEVLYIQLFNGHLFGGGGTGLSTQLGNAADGVVIITW